MTERARSYLDIFKSLQSTYPLPFDCPYDLVHAPPDFVGVGTMRSGTTWWHQLVIQHPAIYMPDFFPADFPVKERHFFDRFCNAELSAQDVEQYRRWFPRPAGRITGEFTPSYLVDHWVAGQLARAAPQARILVLLRDPVERYASGMRFQIGQGEPRTQPELAREQMLRGFYAPQLENLLRSFAREQVLVLQYEQCRADPKGQLQRTYHFLGIDDSWLPRDLSEPKNRSPSDTFVLPDSQRTNLARIYADSTRRVAELLPDFDLTLWPSATRSPA